MRGVLLGADGRPEQGQLLAATGVPIDIQGNIDRGWRIRGWNDGVGQGVWDALNRAPQHVADMLERARQDTGPFGYRASMQSWEELVYATIADGTQVLNTTTETIMVPDFTLPAGYLYPGRALKYTIIGNVSTVITTPGTVTFALRYGGVGGTALATSGAFAPDPTAASTTVTHMVEWYFVCRAVGTSAASFTVGRIEWNDYDDASATTIVGNLNMRLAPASAPAAVNINTTTANALSPTFKSSVATATTQFTAHIAFLEALS